MILDTPRALLLGLLVVALAVYFSGATLAENGRYSFSLSQGSEGARLNTRTGAVELCLVKNDRGGTGHRPRFVCGDSLISSS